MARKFLFFFCIMDNEMNEIIVYIYLFFLLHYKLDFYCSSQLPSIYICMILRIQVQNAGSFFFFFLPMITSYATELFRFVITQLSRIEFELFNTRRSRAPLLCLSARPSIYPSVYLSHLRSAGPAERTSNKSKVTYSACTSSTEDRIRVRPYSQTQI